MLTAEKINKFCSDYLDVKNIKDPYCFNGLQVFSEKEIKTIAIGTTASLNFLNLAKKINADMVIVHHGLFWGRGINKIDKVMQKRLKVLLENDIALSAFHLPLDAHMKIGNNYQISTALGLKKIYQKDICTIGFLENEILFSDFVKKCDEIFEQKNIYSENFGHKKIKKIGICSGGGGSFIEILENENIDVFLTGEISEQHFHILKELSMNFVASGHHATERLGIKNLGKVIKNEFKDLDIRFIKEKCPV